MSVLWDKDWRYKIALDKTNLADVTKFAKNIKNKTASRSMTEEIEFFKKYFSIEQVIDGIQTKSDKDLSDFFNNIKHNLNNLIYIPEELESYYKSVISSTKPEYREILSFVLDKGRKSKTFAPVKNYYKTVLGKFYTPVIAKCNKYADQYKNNIPTKILQEYEVSTSLHYLEEKINSSQATLNLWGKNHSIDYLLKYNNTYGFGKFRSQSTTGLDNTFTVNCPDHKIEENELHMQYFTNVYPGYANFVNFQFEDTTTRDIDFGANFVFNGWSTFSAWHIFPSLYTKNLKIINAKIVKHLFNTPSQKNFSLIYRLLINTYDKSIALKILRQISQMPGKFESRFLGAIATEIVIDKGYALNPYNYLTRLKQVDITNHFTTLNKLK